MRVLLESLPRRSFFILLTLFLATAFGRSTAYAQSDVIRGKVTGVEGPLAGVRVTATSLPGNVTRTATTNVQGSYQIAFPGGPGDYIMGFQASGYAFRQFEVKRVADEQVLVADARLAPVQLDSIVVVAPVQQRVNRFDRTPDVGGTERTISNAALPPELQGNLAAMAASLPGVLLLPGLDGEPDQFSVLGLSGDQNSTTLNGAPVGADGIPRDANVGASLTTSPFDPTRGGFSGANFNLQSRPGSNFQSRGMSLVMTAPQMQWTDRAAQALGNDYTNFSLGGMASGPLQMNKSFYNISYQLGRNSRDNKTLLSTSPEGLQTAGVSSDSVSRFLNILGLGGVPTTGGPARDSRLSDNGSLFGSIDLQPPGSASGQTFGLTFNGNWRRQTPVTSSQLALASSSGDNTSWTGGLQARHSRYFGLILSETTGGLNYSKDFGDPYLTLPGGRVRVNSAFDDGSSVVSNLSFGGNQNLSNSSNSLSGSFQNTLSWFDDANKHRIKLGTEANFNRSTQYQGNNLLGTYTYNSLADLEAGRPSAFTRTLTSRELSTGSVSGAVSLGDSWRKTPDLQFQYGLRVDANAFTTSPTFNPLVESTFGRRNDKLPTTVSVSPRLGVSYTLGSANEISAFSGQFRAPRAVIRGGIGVFANSANAGQLVSALNNTGLPSGVQQINCVGPAVPAPDWTAFGADPESIPETCADGTNGTVFSNSSPNVSLFSKDFAPQKTVRSNVSWNGSILDARFNANVEGTYSLNLNQQRTVDLNFNPVTRFNLADDGRSVFVNPTSIVPATGAVASSDARMSQAFARVTEQRSDLESRTAQLSFRLNPIARTPTRFNWSAGYTYQNVREQVSGFNSTAGNPLDVEWSKSAQGAHSINYMLRYNFFDAVAVTWNGSFRSGTAYTPLIAGDVNGDGYNNDRAFIYSGAAADPTVAEGMQDLLSSASDATRDCLEEQFGNIAKRNSCRAPWSSSASLSISLDRAKFHMPQRAAVSFSLSNPLGAADLLLNGSDKLKGWGQTPSPDQALLYVRGFDPATQRYKYEVNQRFGATRPQFVTLRSPVTLTASLRYDLGPTREEQQLAQTLSPGRSSGGSRLPEAFYRSITASAIQNPMAVILRSQDSLRLTAVQADSIAAMNRRYNYRADSLWTPVAKYYVSLGNTYDDDEAYKRYIEARREQVDMLSGMVRTVRELLSSEQRRKLPASVVSMLDPRYLALIRSGNGMYVSAAGGGGDAGFAPAGGDRVFVEAAGVSAGGGGISTVTVIRQ